MGLFSKGHKAEKAATAAEAARTEQVGAATGRINGIFDDPARLTQRQNFLDAMRANLTQGVQRQATDAGRDLKFALARGGLTGGSVDVSSGRKLQDETTRGLLGAEDKAQGAFSSLLGQDENERTRLLSLASTGADTGRAAEQAAGRMGASISAAGANILPNMIEDIFSGVGGVIKKRKEADAMARGAASVSPWG